MSKYLIHGGENNKPIKFVLALFCFPVCGLECQIGRVGKVKKWKDKQWGQVKIRSRKNSVGSSANWR